MREGWNDLCGNILEIKSLVWTHIQLNRNSDDDLSIYLGMDIGMAIDIDGYI